MTNNSTTDKTKVEIKMKSPRISSINLVREFARAYTSLNTDRFNQMILN